MSVLPPERRANLGRPEKDLESLKLDRSGLPRHQALNEIEAVERNDFETERPSFEKSMPLPVLLIGVAVGLVGVGAIAWMSIADSVAPATSASIALPPPPAERDDTGALEEIPSMDGVFLEAYAPQIEANEERLWSFLLDPIGHSREFDLHWDLLDRKKFEQFFGAEKQKITSVEIEFVRGCAKDDVLILAFLAKTNVNPRGSAVEILVPPDGRPYLDWVRLLQHHYGTFNHFVKKRTLASPQPFFLVVERSHSSAESELAGSEGSLPLRISGNNPNIWIPAFITKGEADKLGWAKKRIIAFVEWQIPEGREHPILLVRHIVAQDWKTGRARTLPNAAGTPAITFTRSP